MWSSMARHQAFVLTQLTTDGLGCEMQLLADPDDAARFGNHPEIPQMPEIQSCYGHTPGK
jgi:hypothetical protein